MPAPEAQTPTSQPAATRACNSRTAYGAPEAPVIPRKTRTRRAYLTPFDASRNVASCLSCWSEKPAKLGIGEPGVLHDGHFRWSICHWSPRFLFPSSVRFGAPNWAPPTLLYVWQFRQADCANSL